ncbi:MAG: hypothetical protein LC122_12745 [Chitinophagales bacterium]|nr:hypothetical protein [Chitinophagales bacterium]
MNSFKLGNIQFHKDIDCCIGHWCVFYTAANPWYAILNNMRIYRIFSLLFRVDIKKKYILAKDTGFESSVLQYLNFEDIIICSENLDLLKNKKILF